MILRGAFEVAGREGLDGMSMPGLASHLNVGVTSIYWYFRNKEELLQEMYIRATQLLQSRMVTSDTFDPDDWRTYLSTRFQQLRSLYSEEDLLADLVLHQDAGHSGVKTPDAYATVEADLAYLVTAGFTLKAAWDVYACLSMFTHGVAINERIRKKSGYPPDGEAQLSMLDVPNVPLLAQLISEEDASIDMAGNAFMVGLELILDSAEARRAVAGGR